jgi:hypothetical protein
MKANPLPVGMCIGEPTLESNLAAYLIKLKIGTAISFKIFTLWKILHRSAN